MTTLTVFEGWELDVNAAEEPRLRDVDIATRAGMKRPRDVRRIIDANRDILAAHGEIRVCDLSAQTSGGRPGTEYWLNEGQAAALVSLLRTPAGRALHIAVIKVFVAWRRGQLTAPPPALPLDVAHGIRIRDEARLLADMKSMCVMVAAGAGRSLQNIYGFLRRTYRVGSPFDIAAVAWPIVKDTLQAVGTKKLLLPTRARVLRLVPKDPRQADLFPKGSG